MTDEKRFDDATKDAGESTPVELNFFEMCANFWRPNEQFSVSEYVRPNVATGFSYLSSGGTSAAKEPRWPKVIDQTVVDGSITWTCKAAAANGLNAITSPSATSDPTGLTISSVAALETAKITATYEGGTRDQDYDAVYSFMLNGVTRIARQTVRVRKR